MTAKITNGTIAVGRTIKTGDYENKRFDVTLSFTVPDDAEGDGEDFIGAVGRAAMRQMNNLIEAKVSEPRAATAKAAAESKAPKPPKGEAKAEPAAKAATDPSGMEDLDPPTPKFIEKEVAAANAKAAEVADENDISSLMGGAEPAKEITDKELQDAAQKCMDRCKNAPGIHKVLRELGIKSPPGRIIDLPQDKRHTYLDELLKIKPLA